VNVREIQTRLHAIGWPVLVDGDFGARTKEAVLDFQAAWTPTENSGFAPLAVDGDVGVKTAAALDLSVLLGGLVSQHFRAREFACKHCGWIKVDRELLVQLEKLRSVAFPHGLSVVSGYRCQAHNRDIGGARNSQHLQGTAADIPPDLSLNHVRSLKLFTGIEYRADDHVYHVDVRRPGSVDDPVVFLWK